MNSNNTFPWLRLRSTILFYSLLTGLLLLLAGTVLYMLGKLTASSLLQASFILLAAIGSIILITISFLALQRIGKNSARFLLTPTGGLLLAFIVFSAVLTFTISQFDYYIPIKFTSKLPLLTPIARSTPTKTSRLSLALDPWNPLTVPSTPFCNIEQGTLWSVTSPGTALSCKDSGVALQKLPMAPYAEISLDRIGNSAALSKSAVRASVGIHFQNTADASTWAAISINVPEKSGNNKFLFKLNARGVWLLQAINNPQESNAQTISSGRSIINPLSEISMALASQNGKLQAFLDNSQVYSSKKTLLSSPSNKTFSLLVLHTDNQEPSSPVLYSDFKLDTYANPFQGLIPINSQAQCSSDEECIQPPITLLLKSIQAEPDNGIITLAIQLTNPTSTSITLESLALRLYSQPPPYSSGNPVIWIPNPINIAPGEKSSLTPSFPLYIYSGISYRDIIEVNASIPPTGDNTPSASMIPYPSTPQMLYQTPIFTVPESQPHS